MEQEKVEFVTDIQMNDLMDFKIYHNYHSFSGLATVLFGIIMIVISCVSIGRFNIAYTLMTGFFGFFFTIYTPIGIYLKVKKQIKTIPAFKEPVKYTVTNEKIALSQGDITEDLLWSDIYKIKFTGKSMVLYITSVNANIIPLRCVDGCLKDFLEIIRKQLKPYQVKFSDKKVLAAVKR